METEYIRQFNIDHEDGIRKAEAANAGEIRGAGGQRIGGFGEDPRNYTLSGRTRSLDDVLERKTAGATTSKKNKDTDSGDSDQAHEDDNDVPDDTVATRQYHIDTNAAQQSVEEI
jgi:hypothetical protein